MTSKYEKLETLLRSCHNISLERCGTTLFIVREVSSHYLGIRPNLDLAIEDLIYNHNHQRDYNRQTMYQGNLDPNDAISNWLTNTNNHKLVYLIHDPVDNLFIVHLESNVNVKLPDEIRNLVRPDQPILWTFRGFTFHITSRNLNLDSSTQGNNPDGRYATHYNELRIGIAATIEEAFTKAFAAEPIEGFYPRDNDYEESDDDE